MEFQYLNEFAEKYLLRCGPPLLTEIISDGNCFFHSLEYANAECNLDPLYREINDSRRNIYDRIIARLTIRKDRREQYEDGILLQSKIDEYTVKRDNKDWSENEVLFEGCLYKNKDIVLIVYDQINHTCAINVIRPVYADETDFMSDHMLFIINITNNLDGYHFITYMRDGHLPILPNDHFMSKINSYRHTSFFRDTKDDTNLQNSSVVLYNIYLGDFEQYMEEPPNSPLSNAPYLGFNYSQWGIPRGNNYQANKYSPPNISPRTRAEVEKINEVYGATNAIQQAKEKEKENNLRLVAKAIANEQAEIQNNLRLVAEAEKLGKRTGTKKKPPKRSGPTKQLKHNNYIAGLNLLPSVNLNEFPIVGPRAGPTKRVPPKPRGKPVPSGSGTKKNVIGTSIPSL